MTTLAVYRTVVRDIGALEESRRTCYFVAPAGLHAMEAIPQRVSGFYADQPLALAAMIDAQHEQNREEA